MKHLQHRLLELEELPSLLQLIVSLLSTLIMIPLAPFLTNMGFLTPLFIVLSFCAFMAFLVRRKHVSHIKKLLVHKLRKKLLVR